MDDYMRQTINAICARLRDLRDQIADADTAQRDQERLFELEQQLAATRSELTLIFARRYRRN